VVTRHQDDDVDVLPDLDALMQISGEERAILLDVPCPECGYTLLGATSGRCPECGEALDAIRMTESQLPWVRRQPGGRPWAYIKTVGVAIFQPKKLVQEMSRRPDERSARRFRLINVIVGTVSFFAIEAVALITSGALNQPVERLGWEFWTWLSVNLALPILLFAITALPYYALRHPELSPLIQRRAAILTLYASAPLAAVFPLLIAIGTGELLAFLLLRDPELLRMGLWMAVVMFLIVLPPIALLDIYRLARRMMGSRPGAGWFAVKILALCIAMFILIYVLVPVTVLAIVLVVHLA
jgi:hypothetical protein